MRSGNIQPATARSFAVVAVVELLQKYSHNLGKAVNVNTPKFPKEGVKSGNKCLSWDTAARNRVVHK